MKSERSRLQHNPRISIGSSLRNLWERLTQPHPSIQKAEQRRRVYLLSSLLLVLAFSGMIAVILTLLIANSTANLLLSAIGVSVTVAAYGISRTKRYTYAAGLTIFNVSTTIVISTVLNDDPENLHFLIIGIILSSLFLSPRTTLVVSSLIIGVIFAIPVVDNTIPFSQEFINEAYIIGLTGLLATVAASIQSKDIEHIEQQAHELAASIQDLKRGREALHKSETRLKNILDKAAEAIISVDESQTIRLFNREAERIFGYQPDDILGEPLDTLIPTDLIDAHHQFVEGFVADSRKEGTGDLHHEISARRKNGEIFPAQAGISSHIEGDKAFLTVIMTDITDRKMAEEKLQRSEKTYRALFEHANDAIFLMTLEGEHLTANQQAADMLGYEREELVGMTFRDNVVVSEYPDAENRKNALLSGQTLPIYERTFRKKSGQEFPVEINVSLIRDHEGEPLYIQSIVRDITERKRAEQELQKVNRALRVLSESNQTVVRATDEQKLLDEVCKIIVEEGKYRFVWFGYVDQDEARTLRPAAFAGQEAGDPDTTDISWVDRQNGDDPAGAAIRAGQPITIKDIQSEMDQSPWRSEAARQGYHSAAALPLLDAGKVFGVLVLYAGGTDAFDEEEIKLLQELASDMAYGIMALRTQVRHNIAEARGHRQLQSLAALREIDLAISSSLDLRVIFHVLLAKVTTLLHLDAACVLLLNPHVQELEFAAGRGFWAQTLQHIHLRLGEGGAGLAALERRIIHVPNLQAREMDFVRSPLFSSEEFIAYYAVPLIAKGQVKGVMEVFQRSAIDPDKEWMDFLEALARQAAIALDNAGMFSDLQRSNLELMLAYDTTIEGWSRALDLRDRETEGHSQRVTEMTVRLGRELGLTDDELVHVRRGALLHDIGKMGIPDMILHKPGPLDDEEWEIMRQHPTYAYDMLSPIAYLRPALDIPHCHHEKWDGTGYPRGLKGNQIPIAARIFALADVWDALRSDRPYRKAWPEEKTLEYIREQAGKHFAPDVVEAFLRTKDETGAS